MKKIIIYIMILTSIPLLAKSDGGFAFGIKSEGTSFFNSSGITTDTIVGTPLELTLFTTKDKVKASGFEFSYGKWERDLIANISYFITWKLDDITLFGSDGFVIGQDNFGFEIGGGVIDVEPEAFVGMKIQAFIPPLAVGIDGFMADISWGGRYSFERYRWGAYLSGAFKFYFSNR